MFFLFITELSLALVIAFIGVKFTSYNLDMRGQYEQSNLWLYYIPSRLPEFFYYKEVIMGIKIGTIAVCGFFILPLLLLILVQVKNFCSAKTTNERFSRRKPAGEVARGSESSSDSLSGKLINEESEDSKLQLIFLLLISYRSKSIPCTEKEKLLY